MSQNLIFINKYLNTLIYQAISYRQRVTRNAHQSLPWMQKTNKLLFELRVEKRAPKKVNNIMLSESQSERFISLAFA